MNIGSTINWGIIGAGDVCEIKSGPAFNKIKGSKLVAVMRRTEHLVKDYAARHNVPKWYTDADELINDPEVNAVYIATRPDTHCAYALKVAAAGKPVYVEKPMARTYSECLLMIDACKRAGVPLFVAYYRRSLPNFLKIKSLLEDGAIGEVRFVDVKVTKPVAPDIVAASRKANNWRIEPEISGGGYFFDLASHQFDMLDFLFGPVAQASGFSANQAGHYAAEDIVAGSFSFDSGVLGTGTWCFTTSPVSDTEFTTIVGSKGQIRFEFFSGDTSVTLSREGKSDEVFRFEMPENIQLPFIETIVNELHGTGTCPCNGVIAARTNRVMDLLTKSNL